MTVPLIRNRLVAAVCAAALCALSSCSRERSVQAGNTRLAPASESASPAVRGADTGLEMWWWVVSEGRSRLGDVLDPYLDRRVPIGEDGRRRWRDNGLRIVAVPIADLDRLQNALPMVGRVQRHWLGQLPEWTDIVRGPGVDGQRTVRFDGGELTLDGGRIRLIARCWTIPVPGGPAALRLELAAQHDPARGRGEILELAAGLRPDEPTERAGVVFSGLSAAMTLPPGEAYLIIPEAPEVSWRAPLDAAPAAHGPETPPIPTPGELMLSALRPGEPAPTARAIIVLIPRVPARYDLIPP